MARHKRCPSRPHDSNAVVAKVRKHANKTQYEKAGDADVQDLRKCQRPSRGWGEGWQHDCSERKVRHRPFRYRAARMTMRDHVHTGRSSKRTCKMSKPTISNSKYGGVDNPAMDANAGITLLVLPTASKAKRTERWRRSRRRRNPWCYRSRVEITSRSIELSTPSCTRPETVDMQEEHGNEQRPALKPRTARSSG